MVLKLVLVKRKFVRLVKFREESDPPDIKTEELSTWTFLSETDTRTAIDMATVFQKTQEELSKGIM